MSRGRGGATKTVITMDAFKALPWEEQFRMFPNEGDIDKAIDEGRLIVQGINDR